MANWHVDLYGAAETDDDAKEAVESIVEEAVAYGLTGGFVASPGVNASVSSEGMPAEPEPEKPAPKAAEPSKLDTKK